MRLRISWIWLTVMLGLLAACAPATPEAVAPAAEKAPPATKLTPKYGGTLVYAPIQAQTSLHPFRPGSVVTLRHVGPAYETLVSFDYQPGVDFRMDFKVVPWLAESWEQPNDNTYVFHLRKGVRWHDGEELTAEDVVFTLDWVSKEKYPAHEYAKDLSSVEATDRYTVKFTLKAPSALFLENLAERNGFIAPKHLYDKGVDFAKVAVGTGPFKIQSFTANKETIWVKNNEYWQKERPYPDGMKQIWGLDASGMLAAFVAGKNDLLALPDWAQVSAVLKTRPDAQSMPWLTDYGVVFYPKLDKPPFSDVRVRRALHLAFDRQSMLQTLTYGKGAMNTLGAPGWKTGWAIPPEELSKMPGFRQPKDEDIAEAKRLLAEAGYPDGFKTTLTYNNEGVAIPGIVEMLPSFARKVGINLVLDPQQKATFDKRDRDGDYETAIVTSVKADLTSGLISRYHSQGTLNTMRLKDPQLDAMIDAIPRTLNLEQRKQVVQELQRYMLETLYAIPTIEYASFGVWQPWVHDYLPSGGNAVTVHQDTVSLFWLDAEKVPADR